MFSFAGFDFTQRAPNPVELYANGPHHALENFENGESSLNKESSYNLSIGYNYAKDLNDIKIEAYYNYIDNFIAADRDGSTVEVEGEHEEEGEEALYEALARGLEAAVELGKLSEEEAEEIWRDMTGDGEEDDRKDD